MEGAPETGWEGTGRQTVPHGVWPPGFRKPVPVKSNMGADQCVLFFELRPEVKPDLHTVPAIGSGRAQEEARGRWHLFWVVKWLLVKYDELKHLFAQPPYRTNKNCKKNKQKRLSLTTSDTSRA